jgi:hypothetical protein
MKKCANIIGAIVLSVWTAAAQDLPKAGTFVGYDNVRFNWATNVRAFNGHLRTQGDNNQNNLRFSAGLAFLFGGEEPTPPPPQPHTKTCPNGNTVAVNAVCPEPDLLLSLAATPRELCPGDSAQVKPSITGGHSRQLSYRWFLNGQQAGQEQSFEFGSAGREPGKYRITLRVGGSNFIPASANTTITIREYHPPTGKVQANPAQIIAGEKSVISASFQGQCGGPIEAPVFYASEGSMQGSQFDSAGVQFDPNNHAEQRRTVTVTAKASDNRRAGIATTTVTVIKRAAFGWR